MQYSKDFCDDYPVIGKKLYKITKAFACESFIDEDVTDRATIRYCEDNYDSILKHVKAVYSEPEEDAKEIVSMLIDELYRKDDYQPIFDESTGAIISIKDFIYHTLKHMRKRYHSKISKRNKMEVSAVHKDGDSGEESEEIFNLIPDMRCLDMTDNISDDLEKALNHCRCYRYILNQTDLFELFYSLFMLLGKPNWKDKYSVIVRAKGLNNKLARVIQRESDLRSLLVSMCRNRDTRGVKYVAECLEKHVYCKESVQLMLSQL